MSGCMAFDCAQESLPGHHYCAGHVAPSSVIDALRARVAELEAERDGAVAVLQRIADAGDASEACPAAHLRIGTTTVSAPLPLDPSQWQLLTDALDFIADNEWAGRTLVDGELFPSCPDCGALKGQAHSEQCREDGILRRAGCREGVIMRRAGRAR